MPVASHVRFAEATEGFIRDLEDLIDRRFAVNRIIRVEQTEDGRYCAVVNGAGIFPATPDLDTVIRFVRAFAIQTEGVVVDEESVERWRHSVRVPVCSRCGETMRDETTTLNGRPTHIRCPRDYPMILDNVVELRAGA